MIKSMTGYGTATGMIGGNKVTVEIKAVNHRYNDIAVKTPRTYGFLEEPTRSRLLEKIARGKVDVYVNLETYSDDDKEVLLNRGLADGYARALCELKDAYGLKEDISLGLLARFPDVLKLDAKEIDKDAFLAAFFVIFDQAADDFVASRLREGEKLRSDVLSHVNAIEEAVEKVRLRAPGIVQDYRDRMEARMKEILEAVPYDESRLLTEVAIFTDRVNVNEEVVRLGSHLSEVRSLMDAKEPVGRRLDFVVQEMNREINTIGSKSNDLETAQIVVDVKTEIEKIREQIQNME